MSTLGACGGGDVRGAYSGDLFGPCVVGQFENGLRLGAGGLRVPASNGSVVEFADDRVFAAFEGHCE